jgi:acetoin utilization protein AcuB
MRKTKSGSRPVRVLSSAHSRDRTIAHFMTRSPHSIGKDQKLALAHRLMRTYRIRHLPVLQGGKLVGMVSQRDLYFLESIHGVDPETDTVEDAMSSDTYRVRPTDPLARVVKTMAEKKLGSAVVVEGAKVVGVFTTTDALRTLSRMLDHE